LLVISGLHVGASSSPLNGGVKSERQGRERFSSWSGLSSTSESAPLATRVPECTRSVAATESEQGEQIAAGWGVACLRSHQSRFLQAAQAPPLVCSFGTGSRCAGQLATHSASRRGIEGAGASAGPFKVRGLPAGSRTPRRPSAPCLSASGPYGSRLDRSSSGSSRRARRRSSCWGSSLASSLTAVGPQSAGGSRFSWVRWQNLLRQQGAGGGGDYIGEPAHLFAT